MGNKVFLFLGLLLVCSCAQKGGNNELSFKESIKLDQYIVEGRDLYLQNCSNCHQKDGKGLGRLYPPLNQSDYMVDNVDNVICLIKNGISGEIVVNGQKYGQPMPGIAELTPLEIAEITTYVYNVWELKEGLIDVKKVEKTLEGCGQ